MAIRVPDTDTFCLENVVLAVEDHAGATDGSLQDSFDNSHPAYFDDNYDNDTYAPANSMKRFRNYGPPYCFVKNTFHQNTSPNLGGGFYGNGTQGIWFTETGYYMFIIYYDFEIRRFSLSTSWDITTATEDQNAWLNSGTNYSGLYWRDDGLVFYTINRSLYEVEKWGVSSPFRLSSVTHLDSWNFSSYDNGIGDIFFDPNGTKMYLVGNEHTETRLYQFTLSTAWDISGVMFYTSVNVAQVFPIVGVFLSGDGKRVFVLEQDPNYIRQVNLATAYDIGSWNWTCYGVFNDYYDEYASGFFVKERVGDGELDVYMVGNENRKVYWFITTETTI